MAVSLRRKKPSRHGTENTSGTQRETLQRNAGD